MIESRNDLLIDLSEKEHQFVCDASKRLGKPFDFAHDFCTFLTELVVGVSDSSQFGKFAICFHHAVGVYLIQALLSTARNHSFQAHLIMRLSIESAIKTCFLLSGQNRENLESIFKTNLKVGCSDEENIQNIDIADSKLKKLANDWIQLNFPNQNDYFKTLKSVVNDTVAHGGLLSSASIIRFEGQDVKSIYFSDADPVPYLEQIAAICRAYLSIVIDLNCKKTVFIFCENWDARSVELMARFNEVIKE